MNLADVITPVMTPVFSGISAAEITQAERGGPSGHPQSTSRNRQRESGRGTLQPVRSGRGNDARSHGGRRCPPSVPVKSGRTTFASKPRREALVKRLAIAQQICQTSRVALNM